MRLPEDVDARAFNWAVDLGHKLIDRGFAKAWFTWLEWVAATALLYVAGRHAQSASLLAVAGVSALVLFFVGLAGTEKLCDALLPPGRSNIWLLILITLVVNLGGFFVISTVLSQILFANTP